MLQYYTKICLAGQMETMKNFNQDSHSPGWKWNSEPLKYEAGVSPI
jgi:hypothetical protein